MVIYLLDGVFVLTLVVEGADDNAQATGRDNGADIKPAIQGQNEKGDEEIDPDADNDGDPGATHGKIVAVLGVLEVYGP